VTDCVGVIEGPGLSAGERWELLFPGGDCCDAVTDCLGVNEGPTLSGGERWELSSPGGDS
jgi:hypothetical protein